MTNVDVSVRVAKIFVVEIVMEVTEKEERLGFHGLRRGPWTMTRQHSANKRE